MSAKMKLLPSSLLGAYVNEKWQSDLPSLGYKLSLLNFVFTVQTDEKSGTHISVDGHTDHSQGQ